MHLLRLPRRGTTAAGLLFAASLSSPWSALAEIDIERDKRQQRPGFVGVVGNWLPVNDDGPAFKIDGATWKGETARSDLEGAGKALFASLGDPFYENGMAAGAFPLAVWNDGREFSGGQVRVQFKLIGGASDQTAGIAFGLAPNGEYLFMRYNTKDGNVAIWGYSNGQRRVIAHGETHVQLPLNTWHELVLTVSGNKVAGSVAGSTLTVDHTFDAAVGGRVGVWTKRDAVTVFKNFRIAR